MAGDEGGVVFKQRGIQKHRAPVAGHGNEKGRFTEAAF
jgi:hypothetical protein